MIFIYYHLICKSQRLLYLDLFKAYLVKIKGKIVKIKAIFVEQYFIFLDEIAFTEFRSTINQVFRILNLHISKLNERLSST